MITLIKEGVLPDWPEPDLQCYPCHRSLKEEAAALELMAEYMQCGAATLLGEENLQASPTRFLIPWFLIVKEDKTRLIADCRTLNRFLHPPHFRLDNWGEIFPFLRKGMWGAKVDLKHAYFHLKNSARLLPYMRINIGENIYQFEAAVFGLNVLPQLFMMVMKVLQKIWREKGLLVFVYLDDILVLGTTRDQVANSLAQVLSTLDDAGFLVNQKKSTMEPVQNLEHLGFTVDLASGRLGVPSGKLRTIRRELGKLVTHPVFSARKMACILGTVRSFLTAMPFLRAFTGHMLRFVDLHKVHGWDKTHPIPPDLKLEVLKVKELVQAWEGRQFQGICPVREIHSDSSQEGWGGVDLTGGGGPGVLAGSLRFAYKCEGATGCSSQHKKPSEMWGTCDHRGRQQCGFQLPEKRRGQKNAFKCFDARSVGLVHGARHSSSPCFGPIGRVQGRCPEQDPPGQGGLHITPGRFQGSPLDLQGLAGTPPRNMGHVFQPGKSQVSQICVQVPPLAGLQTGRFGMSRWGHSTLLRKSPLELHCTMATEAVGKPPLDLFNGDPLVGFSRVVAPFAQNAGHRFPRGESAALSRFVHQFRGGGHAPHPVAPDLHVVIRQKLQEQQVSPQNIEAYLKQLPNLQRYQNAFSLLWNMAVDQGAPLNGNPPLGEVAALLVRMNLISTSQARNCYSALLLIPGFDQLRFSPLLRQCKRAWNQGVPKYPAFYSASDLLKRLQALPFNWSSIQDVRDRLIICWRFVQLTRSIDLARMYRKISHLQGKPYIFIHRKGWLGPRWEEVVCLPSVPSLCPWTLLCKYVSLTRNVPEGGLVIRSLHAPWNPLSANSVGSLTAKMLAKLGLPKGIWGPHSTRGAGVKMYKELGLSSEQVCEIGKWKNTGAFAAHYLRIGAPSCAQERLENMVHNVSLGGSAEPDWSRTPGSPSDPGGSDQEGEAQTPNEPTRTLPKRPRSLVQEPPFKFQFAARRHLPRQPPSDKQ